MDFQSEEGSTAPAGCFPQKSYFWWKAPSPPFRRRPERNPYLSPAHILPWFLATWFLVPFSHAAINASQTLILQTGGIERARLNTLGLITASISATEVSTTVIKWGTRTQPTCNAAAKGQMLHTTSTTAPLQFCDGANWRILTLDGGGDGTQTYSPSCLAILQSGASTGDGIYTLYPKGDDTLILLATCDMTTDGGGWTLVLNYLHKGGTNPANSVLKSSLPLQKGTSLGTDESGPTSSWGHTAPSLLSSLATFTHLRFYCQTSAHARVVHFKTTNTGLMAHFKTGSGLVSSFSGNYNLLAGHTANLPAVADSGHGNQNDYAMTRFPFYQSAQKTFAASPQDNRWDCDDISNSNYNTHHQIWVR